MRFRHLLLSCLLGLLAWAQAGAEETLTNEWAVNLGSHSDGSPAVAEDGTIYCGTLEGQLWALNADGSHRWVFHAGNEIRSSPALGADGTVYFGSRDRKLYAVGANGKKRWEFKTGAWVDSSAALGSDGTIYFGSWDKRFYALKPDGSERWHFQTGGEVVSSPAIGNEGVVFFGSHDGKLYALKPEGTQAWEFATGGPIISSPAIAQDGTVYFTSLDGYVYAVDASGQLRWRLHTGGITESSPVIGADGTIYVGANIGLWAITPQGAKKGERAEGYRVETAPVAAADNSVCYVSWFGVLVNLGPDLQRRWHSFMCNSHGFGSPTLAADGMLYVPDCGNKLHAFKTQLRLANSPWPRFRGDLQNTGNRYHLPLMGR